MTVTHDCLRLVVGWTVAGAIAGGGIGTVDSPDDIGPWVAAGAAAGFVFGFSAACHRP